MKMLKWQWFADVVFGDEGRYGMVGERGCTIITTNKHLLHHPLLLASSVVVAKYWRPADIIITE